MTRSGNKSPGARGRTKGAVSNDPYAPGCKATPGLPTVQIESDGVSWVLHEGGRADERPPFDLQERTAIFGEAIVRLSKRIPRGPGNDRLIDQLVGCGTSLGANYCEANESVSRKDFLLCLSRCRKETKETLFFLRMIAASVPEFDREVQPLRREARELLLIFSAMSRK
mgnify:CR=1 FL=1